MNDLNFISPPSLATAGLILLSKISFIFFTISSLGISFSFLEKASLIITINSTVALDALLWGTPSMVFANNSLDYQDWGYSIMSEIKKIPTFENLSPSISKYIDSQVDLKAVTKFIKFLETSLNVEKVKIDLTLLIISKVK